MPVQYLVFMIFAWYGYNKHAFTLTDSVESDSELWAAFAWVILLVVMDFGSTALTHVAVARVQVCRHVCQAQCAPSHDLDHQKINMTRLLSFVLSEHWWFLISNVALMYIFVISLVRAAVVSHFGAPLSPSPLYAGTSPSCCRLHLQVRGGHIRVNRTVLCFPFWGQSTRCCARAARSCCGAPLFVFFLFLVSLRLFFRRQSFNRFSKLTLLLLL